VILEWRDDVRLGMIRLWSALSRVGGRSPVRGRRLSEGAIISRRCDRPLRDRVGVGDIKTAKTPRGYYNGYKYR
jgi:hypothetical protein